MDCCQQSKAALDKSSKTKMSRAPTQDILKVSRPAFPEIHQAQSQYFLWGGGGGGGGGGEGGGVRNSRIGTKYLINDTPNQRRTNGLTETEATVNDRDEF